MIESNVLKWATVVLVCVLAFYLLPTYERFGKQEEFKAPIDELTPPIPEPVADIQEDPLKNFLVRPVRETFTDLPTSTTLTAIPPTSADPPKMPGSQDSPTVHVLASVGAPVPKKSAPSVGGQKESAGTKTLPPPTFSNDDSKDPMHDYVLKSSLVPCTCPSQGMSCSQHAGSYPSSVVPGEAGPSAADTDIQKPFSAAFTGGGNVSGYLNSFSAFG